jgi:hypothetical protein
MRPLLPALGLFLVLAANAGCTTTAGSSAFELHTDDYQRVRGTYAMQDGHVVYVVGTRRHPRIEFDDGQSAALHASSPTDFLTPDGCTRLRFELDKNATLARLHVTHGPAC